MFIPGDIYSSSGSVKLYHCWTDRVTHYDSSSFYNWEQDDLPIYDFDERTHYLWEQLGYPTSSVPGVALVVSADAPASAVTCNKNIFRTVSAAIEALPQTINYPVLIEVANFGQLGDLVIDGVKFGPRGSLEIINRNFSHSYCTVSTADNTGGLLPPVYAYFAGGGIDGTAGNTFSYLSAMLGNDPAYLSPATILDTTPLAGMINASCLSISAAVFSGTRDARLSGVGSLAPKLNAYVSLWKERDNYARATMAIDDYSVNPYRSDNFTMSFKAYDLNSESFDDIHNKDASSLNLFSNTSVAAGPGWNGFNLSIAYNGLYYGNKLAKVKISNCGGPIYVRNFFLDGSGADKTDNKYGVEVLNCPNVFLENTVVTRFRKAGFKFTDSNVKLLRGCVASRIYDFDSTNVRITEPYALRRKAITNNITSGLLRDDESAGLLAENSIVTVSSTHLFEYPLVSAALGVSANPYIPSYYILEFTKSTYGMILNNSVFQGGKGQEYNLAPYPSYYETTIDFAHNVAAGIKANNSKISVDGKLRLIENLEGLDLKNSVLEIDKLTCVGNQGRGIKSFNSHILYNKNLNKFHTNGTIADTYHHPWHFEENGQHILLNNSTMVPMQTSSMEEIYGRMSFFDPIGKLNGALYTDDGFAALESVKLENNSHATFISPAFRRDPTHSLPSTGIIAQKGSELHVLNNSTATLKGTKHFATRCFGPSGHGNCRTLIGMAAENNSNIIINGPTVIGQYGVAILGENNSKIQMSPPKNSFDNTIDISSINLADAGNHTAVELHSVRSCITVDKHSLFLAKDLGNFVTCWTRSGDFVTLTTSGLDYETVAGDIQLYTSGGSLQFYPNPVPPNGGDYTSFQGVDSFTVGVRNQEAFDDSLVSTRGQSFLLALNTSPLNFSAATFGGMCVRALNNSIVDVNNVNFPCGHWNPSGPFFDGVTTFSEGGACYRPFIWNIADTSQLKAGFLSVSGLYPIRAGYHGPAGYWTSAASAANYGSPSSTPDTSTLSVLDIYGANPSATPFSYTTKQNYGPFRLYFGVDPFVNTLTHTNGVGYGIIPQIYAQGYQPSANLICSGSASSMYLQALQRNAAGTVAASGFYYGEDVIAAPGIRALVDQSAAETFANAKHCSAGKSNAAKVVGIYLPYDQVDFGDSVSVKGIASLNMFDIERNN